MKNVLISFPGMSWKSLKSIIEDLIVEERHTPSSKTSGTDLGPTTLHIVNCQLKVT